MKKVKPSAFIESSMILNSGKKPMILPNDRPISSIESIDDLDFDQHEPMEKMSVGTNNNEHDVSLHISRLWATAKPLLKQRSIILMLLTTSLLLFSVLLFSGHKSNDDLYSKDMAKKWLSQRPLNLRSLILDTTEKAKVSGGLQSLSISSPEYVMGNGIEFLVSYASLEKKDSSSNIKNKDSAVVATDPFDKQVLASSSSSLVITKVVPSHTLVLNKFNTIKDHSLLVTDDFISQSTALTALDFDAWYWAIEQAGAVGFYNSNWISGASQKHKHMQIIPLDVLLKIRKYDATNALPIDDIIEPEIASGRWKPINNKGSSVVYTIPEFPFKHAIANIYSSQQWESQSENIPLGVYLESVYNTLLESTGIYRQPCSNSNGEGIMLESSPLGIPDEFCIGYNAIMTSKWMMIVPRSQRDFVEADGSVGVNGFGFIGLLLARNEKAAKTIEEKGPIEILKAVTL